MKPHHHHNNHTRILALLALALAALQPALPAPAQPSAPAQPATAPANTATQPCPRDPKWVKRHEGFVETANAKPAANCQILFIGDSITDFWLSKTRGAPDIWQKYFGRYNPVNLGISGDRTQHVLWRLQNGELGVMRPKAIVLMIGTNNTGYEPDKTTPRNTPAETAEGVKSIIAYLRATLPDAKILLLAIFPRGNPADLQRAQVAEINALIRPLHDGKTIYYLDIGAKFLTPDGAIPKTIMPDLLHPNAAGYQLWADAIAAPLSALLK